MLSLGLGGRDFSFWGAMLSVVSVALAGPVLGDGRSQDENEKMYEDLERRIEELEGKLRQDGSGGTGAQTRRGLLPPISLGAYANVNYLYRDEAGSGVDGENKNHFALGEFDLYLVSKISDRFSALAELIFEFESDGETVADVERLLIKYEHRDWLSVSVGRGHTPVGYWNRAYHHGTYLWTTIDRPVIVEFEDEGGFCPCTSSGWNYQGSTTPVGGCSATQQWLPMVEGDPLTRSSWSMTQRV